MTTAPSPAAPAARLTALQAAVLGSARRRAEGGRNGSCRAVARETGLSEFAVHGALATLRRLGLLEDGRSRARDTPDGNRRASDEAWLAYYLGCAGRRLEVTWEWARVPAHVPGPHRIRHGQASADVEDLRDPLALLAPAEACRAMLAEMDRVRPGFRCGRRRERKGVAA